MISFLYCQARSVRASLDQLTFNPFNPFNPFNTSSQIGRIRSPSASELCQIQGYGWIWRSLFRAYEMFSTGILSS